jgi:Domain of unknown function (DUF5668)
MSASNRGALVWGIVLVLLGLVFLLNNFNVVPGGVLDWWPVLVLGAGVWLLGQGLTRRRGGGLVSGTVLLALGTFWLLSNFGRVDDQLFVPILLIAIGVGLLLRSLLRAP